MLFKPERGWAHSDRSGTPDFEFAANVAHQYGLPFLLDPSVQYSLSHPPFPVLNSWTAYRA